MVLVPAPSIPYLLPGLSRACFLWPARSEPSPDVAQVPELVPGELPTSFGDCSPDAHWCEDQGQGTASGFIRGLSKFCCPLASEDRGYVHGLPLLVPLVL